MRPPHGRVAVLAHHLRPAPAASEEPLRLAIVGTGVWGLQGYQHLRSHPEVRVVAVVEPQEERRKAAARLFKGSSAFGSFDELLGSGLRLDAALIAAPHVVHFELGTKAIRAGLHVLMEKPMTTDPREAAALVEAAKAAGTVLMVNNTANFSPQCEEAARTVEGGGLGAVEHVACHMAGALRELIGGEIKEMASTWADPKRSGGYGWGQLSHILAWVFRVSGLAPSEAFCYSGLGPSGVDFYSATAVRCTSGATISISGAATLPDQTKERGKQIDVRVFGSEGCLSYTGRDEDPGSGELLLERRDGGRRVAPGGFVFEEVTRPPGSKGFPRESASFPRSHASFIAACRGRPFFDGASGDVGRRVVQTLDAMYRSARSGRPEAVR
mmetsp:Transcript_120326/g.374654  ORF Transcript_120326/g.374654 Transcript_120326/m.374654 type:complete len:384 (-) Transcript_120326:7-1158(-)